MRVAWDRNTRATGPTASRRLVGEVEPGGRGHPSELCDGRGKIKGKVSPGLCKKGDRGHSAKRGPSGTVRERACPPGRVVTPQTEDLDRGVKTQMLDGSVPGASVVPTDADFGDRKNHLVAGALGRGGGQSTDDAMPVRTRRDRLCDGDGGEDEDHEGEGCERAAKSHGRRVSTNHGGETT